MNLGLPGASLFSGLRLTIVIRFPSLFINARWWWQGTPNVRVIWSTSCFLFFSFLWLTNLTGSCRGSQWYGFSCFHRKEENKNYRLSFHSSFLLLNAHNVCMLSFLFFFHREGKKKEPFSFYALVSNSIHDSGVYPTIPRPDNFLFRLSSFFLSNNKRNQAQTWGGLVFIRERIIITSWRRRISRNDGYRFLVTMTTHVPAFFAFHPHLETHFFFSLFLCYSSRRERRRWKTAHHSRFSFVSKRQAYCCCFLYVI